MRSRLTLQYLTSSRAQSDLRKWSMNKLPIGYWKFQIRWHSPISPLSSRIVKQYRKLRIAVYRITH